MSSTDAFVANSESYAASFDKGDLPLSPAKGTAVVACMTPGFTLTASSGSPKVTHTSSATPAGSSPTTSSAPSPSPSACWGRPRSS